VEVELLLSFLFDQVVVKEKKIGNRTDRGGRSQKKTTKTETDFEKVDPPTHLQQINMWS